MSDEDFEAIKRFEKEFPDWWWSIGKCFVSRDASCGPQRKSKDGHLLNDRVFDNGFHSDHEGTIADALQDVSEQIREALNKKVRTI